MIRSPWRRGEDPGLGELARLLPDPGAPELPADRRLLLEEHLMREMTKTSVAPSFRRRMVLVSVPVATAAVIVAAVTFARAGDGGGTAAASGSTLARLAAAAAAVPEVEVGDDQFIYTAGSVTRDMGGAPNNGDNVERVEHGPYEFEQWLSPDGGEGWYVNSELAPDGLRVVTPDWPMVAGEVDGEVNGESLIVRDGDGYPIAEAVPDPDHVPGVGGEFPANLRQPSYDYLRELTTDPDALLGQIYEENGQADSEDQADQWAFETIGGIFEDSLLPPDLSEALFLAMDRIPGVTVGAGTDAVGREGVAVSRVGADLGYEMTYVFEESTGAHLGSRAVEIEDGHFHPEGTVFTDLAITERIVVDGLPAVSGIR
ncbi:CU044_5270 family protein [Streptomyces litchfieldiae]|uniref:CU044_5270 family protein n=1 Tax=Streptomyces litchfieldiae TaxID=3075543 RepID=A0ABU2MRU4_9ACTN|nr:CU044_5270 family protein [Streptomyces sp. DSM 44938]MDT0343329.1 CU044_5270 family protein [Streptomyces sp. DSM 44938]